MESELARAFLGYSADKLEQLAGRIADCIGKLSDDQIWCRGTENENAVGNLVLHLCGNVRQWIGAGVAGQTDIRRRDAEFHARGGLEAEALRERLRAAVAEAAAIIRDLPEARLSEDITVQAYPLSVLEAIYHVVEHFAQHTGQILYATKQMTGQDLGYYSHLSRAARRETTP